MLVTKKELKEWANKLKEEEEDLYWNSKEDVMDVCTRIPLNSLKDIAYEMEDQISEAIDWNYWIRAMQLDGIYNPDNVNLNGYVIEL